MGRGPNYDRNIIAPSDAYMRQATDNKTIFHCQGHSSVGFYGEAILLPKNVSFANLTFREGGGVAQASGFYATANGIAHQPTGYMYQVKEM